ncbi:diguanylate cyclase [Actinoplanes sp. TRM 88003]|uniref:Diguanylate cyclase n=1 Tax=Paractinoplanes aksuensis TaxID=2939490 RepID=A0ABT1DEX5_9ACTN|nr:diguanylate cyclase [Actinoplanes aksuensis]MCO8269379.1 diguanylate cyclase [Actinoplanes aksuensis]
MGAESRAGQPGELPMAGLHHVVLTSTDRTLIKRLYLPDGDTTVIWKQFLGPGGPTRRRREHAVLLRLAGAPGIGRLSEWTHPDAELLVDVGGRTLAYAMAAHEIELVAVPRLAHRLARIIAGMHARGVVHKDINPSNILIDDAGRPVLTDFDAASLFTEDHAAFGNLHEIEGTLQYLPPEQTGRTGLPVDHRADLYALGATLYEVVAGHPPLAHDDDLQHLRDLLLRVPVPLSGVRAQTPPMLSEIVAKLLEKEPGRRYQSAEGLAHDLARLRERPAATFPLAERDFPLRLTAPSMLIGRDAEVTVLRAAWEEAVLGGDRGVLVAGAAGTGKSALVNALRRPVAARGGWFATGRADPARAGATAGPVLQALRRLGSLLLAEPPEALAALRLSLLTALGPNTGLITAAVPEFGPLLQTEDGDAPPGEADAGVRLRQAVVALLGTVADPRHPVLLALDDLQWADPTSIALLDAILTEPGLRGVLVVGAYRPDELDAEHPLSVLLERRQPDGTLGRRLELGDLPLESSCELLREALRLPAVAARDLAALLHRWTGGNPSDTLELVNALRRGGALTLGDNGWRWDDEQIRQQAARSDVVGLLRDRIESLPPESGRLLRLLALLGGKDVTAPVLARAAGLSLLQLQAPMYPLLDEELVVVSAVPGDPAAPLLPMLRHERVRRAALAGLPDEQRRRTRLEMARHLAGAADTAIFAAEQYLEATGLVTEAGERRTMARLFTVAAGRAAAAGNHQAAEAFAGAAVEALGPGADGAARLDALGRRHAALYQLGRLDEADTVYADVEQAEPDAIRLTDVAFVQFSSLAQRSRQREALDLGLDLLVRLGYELPGPAFRADIPALCADIQAWAARLDLTADLARPEITDPRVLAVTRVLGKIMPMCFLLGERLLGPWVLVQAWRLWDRHGPSPQLVATLSSVGMMLLQVIGDYRAGVRIGRHMLAVSEQRDYEPFTSLVRYRYAMQLQVWTDPLELTIAETRRAYDGLVRGGELEMAAGAWNAVILGRLESAPTVADYVVDIEAALDFDARTGNDFFGGVAVAHRQLARALQGGTTPAGSLDDDGFTEAGHLAGLPTEALTTNAYHVARALAAAIFGDDAALQRHAGAAQRSSGVLPGYLGAQAQVLAMLAHATRLHHVAPADRPADPGYAQITDGLAWIRARAEDCPANFEHLAHWLAAEEAWLREDLPAAFFGFDNAVQQAQRRQRPWHTALILERAAKLYASVGLGAGARLHIAEALRGYGKWGATGKVAQLLDAHPDLRPATRSAPARSRGTGPLRSDAVDTTAILRASQALSEATDLGQLRRAINEQLTALTGASEVVLVIRSDDDSWYLPGGPDGADALDLEGAEMYGLLPASAFQYAVRTRSVLLVEDATRDDRFARDPFLANAQRCSLLVVPVLHGETLRAVLVLANRQTSGLFTAERLDAVTLITGQLVVSLNNARYYADLDAQVAARTRELAAANTKLEELSSTDAMTGLANRRRFEQALSAHHDRLDHSGRPYAIMMIDVDLFKKYNDRFGHQAGDECLRKVGAALAAAIRAAGTDLACRYGGEEFVLILGDSDPAVAALLAERTRAGIQALRIPHPDGPAGVVTVSIGVAVAAVPAETTSDLMRRADAALYEAKAAGRNGVRIAEPLVPV